MVVYLLIDLEVLPFLSLLTYASSSYVHGLFCLIQIGVPCVRRTPARPVATRNGTWDPQIQSPGAFPPDRAGAPVLSLAGPTISVC